MTRGYILAEAGEQIALRDPPYDRWIAESGAVMAEFHRDPAGWRVRFPGAADFVVDARTLAATCEPTPETNTAVLEALWHNSMLPLLDNHGGGISLHGSACVFGGKAVGFVGASRRGKTTLAAACALAGHPFLSEDAIRLSRTDGQYTVLPARPVMRLLPDSASALLDSAQQPEKLEIGADERLCHHPDPVTLHAIYLLGGADVEQPEFAPVGQQAALAELLRHAFILDIEDKPRLTAHFDRLAQLVHNIAFVQLNYPRRFDALPEVVSRLANHVATL